ncbi:MAG: helix-turn-helix domain-containing protein [Gammaproteobacteria bacterium]|nr:helix-turn-helix domain-containing protein [Gammaproteobacteria bacterium]
MDQLIDAAARALAGGDPIGALQRVALRTDAPALALRGIAMAQLGEFRRARALLRSAARAFDPRDTLARARCTVAEAEVALASRELAWPTQAIDAACTALEAHGDLANAAHARLLQARRSLLIGRIDAAERAVLGLDQGRLPPASRAVYELVVAGIETRRLHIRAARAALARATDAAIQARIPALMAEVESMLRALNAPAARLIARGSQRPLLCDDVEMLLASAALVIDACRLSVRLPGSVVSLATRPVLFTLVRTLAEAWPGGASRVALATQAFRLRRTDESLRARLRVEIGRLRRLLRPLAGIEATALGFRLVPGGTAEVVVLALPSEAEDAAVLALVGDGESWSTSALALALGISQRSIQRSLESLAAARKVQAFGRGRARRWTLRQVPGFTTSLLLPAALPID